MICSELCNNENEYKLFLNNLANIENDRRGQEKIKDEFETFFNVNIKRFEHMLITQHIKSRYFERKYIKVDLHLENIKGEPWF